MKSLFRHLVVCFVGILSGCGSNPMGDTWISSSKYQQGMLPISGVASSVATNECPTSAAGSLNFALGSVLVEGSAAISCALSATSSAFQGAGTCACTNGACSVSGLTFTTTYLASMLAGVTNTINTALQLQFTSGVGTVATSVAVVVNASTWSPTCLGSQLTLWMDGSQTSSLFNDTAGTVAITNGAGVGLWKDISGNGYTATQATVANKPIYNSANHSLTFNGSSDFLTTTLTGATFNGTNGTLFAMLAPSGANTTDTGILDFRFAAGNNTGLIYYNTTTYGWDWGTSTAYLWNTGLVPTVGQFAPVGLLNNASTVTMSMNGNAVSTNAYAGTSSNVNGGVPMMIGQDSNGGRFYFGQITEVLVSNADIGSFERQQLEGYMAWKWGTASHLPVTHPYFGAAP